MGVVLDPVYLGVQLRAREVLPPAPETRGRAVSLFFLEGGLRPGRLGCIAFS